jgi:ABC-type hemin transport system ATPase subunit
VEPLVVFYQMVTLCFVNTSWEIIKLGATNNISASTISGTLTTAAINPTLPQ